MLSLVYNFIGCEEFVLLHVIVLNVLVTPGMECDYQNIQRRFRSSHWTKELQISRVMS